MANRIVLNTISYHGKGAIAEIPGALQARGYRKAFVCTDPDLLRFGVSQKVTALLDAAGFAYEVYSDIKANPTIENVQHGVKAFQAAGADCIVAAGAVVTGKTRAPDGSMLMGSPARVVRALTEEDKVRNLAAARGYAAEAEEYR